MKSLRKPPNAAAAARTNVGRKEGRKGVPKQQGVVAFDWEGRKKKFDRQDMKTILVSFLFFFSKETLLKSR